MLVVEDTNRQALLERGWYVATEVEIAFMGLSARAHDLLIILKHFQGQNADAFPSREKLAEVMNLKVRRIQDLLNELRAKGAVKSRRTGRSSRYRVSYAQATIAELQILMGGPVEIPEDLRIPDVQDPCLSDVQDHCTSDLYKEPPTKNHSTPTPLRGVGDAVAPQSEISPEDEMSRKNPQQPERDEFDPVAALGEGPQESLQDLPDGPETLFPDEEITQPPTGRQRPTRSPAQRDSAMALAFEFERLVRAEPWAGPSPVNKSGLAGQFAAWRRDGVTADQIRAMMQRYISDASMRSTGKTPWLDFTWKRTRLLAAVTQAESHRAIEDNRYQGEEHWLGSMAGGQ